MSGLDNMAVLDNSVGSNSSLNGTVLRMPEWEKLAREADFRPAKMATLFSVSERQLQRIFRKQLRCTPRHWLREIQCHLARELISQGYSSKAAAAELRFASESHFCREFKKVFGTPPQAFAPRPSTYLKLVMAGREQEEANRAAAQNS
jgi:AraC-like DNA-binding protein